MGVSAGMLCLSGRPWVLGEGLWGCRVRWKRGFCPVGVGLPPGWALSYTHGQVLVHCREHLLLVLASVCVRGCPPVSWGRPDCRGNGVKLVDLQACGV